MAQQTIKEATNTDRAAGRVADVPKAAISGGPAVVTANSTANPNALNSPDKVTKRQPGSVNEVE